MKIFEEGGPLDPLEEQEPPLPPEPETYPVARGRSAGILALTIADLALAVLAAGAVVFLIAARSYLLTESSDFGTEMSDALVGLRVLITAGCVLAVGFLLSGLGVLSLTRLGYRLQALWALLLCFVLVGIPYGLPVLLFLRRPATHARFFY